MGAISPAFDRALKKQGWPTTPAQARTFPVDDNPLFAATQALSLIGYPNQREQQQDGPAHKFCAALLADIFRYSRNVGDIDALPAWVAAVKPETMRGEYGAAEDAFSTLLPRYTRFLKQHLE